MSRQVRFRRALDQLELEGILDRTILINAASLRILGIRVYTYFIDLLVPKSYYLKKIEDSDFLPSFELEPLPLTISRFQMRLGTIDKDLCSFRHLVRPYNIYVEIKYQLEKKEKFIKIRPHEYVRKDCDKAIEKMVQRFDKRYWQDLYSYHKQIEAIDLGMSNLEFGSHKKLDLENT
jgi:hypothetical protein